MRLYLECASCDRRKCFRHTEEISEDCPFCGAKFLASEVDVRRREQQWWLSTRWLHPDEKKPSRKMRERVRRILERPDDPQNTATATRI